MRSSRFLVTALIGSVMLFSAGLPGPPPSLAQSSTPPAAEEAKQPKAPTQQKVAPEADKPLKGPDGQKMKTRGRNKPGDYPLKGEQGPAGGKQKSGPCEKVI